MQSKDIKRLVIKQLKTKLPYWRRLTEEQMQPEVGQQRVHTHAANPCRSSIAFDPEPGRFHVLAFDHRFHQLPRLRVGETSLCRDP